MLCIIRHRTSTQIHYLQGLQLFNVTHVPQLITLLISLEYAIIIVLRHVCITKKIINDTPLYNSTKSLEPK